MTQVEFQLQRERLFPAHESLLQRRNEPLPDSNGWFQRYRYPVLTAAHTPLSWRYDLDPGHQSVPDGAPGHQRGVQCRRHGVERRASF